MAVLIEERNVFPLKNAFRTLHGSYHCVVAQMEAAEMEREGCVREEMGGKDSWKIFSGGNFKFQCFSLRLKVRRSGEADRLQGRGERGRQRQAHPGAEGGDQQVEEPPQGRGHRGGGRYESAIELFF